MDRTPRGQYYEYVRCSHAHIPFIIWPWEEHILRHRYGSDDNPGGQLSFGSFSAQYTSVDVAQIATTTGAIFTQFGQATGWKNDVRRMLDLLEGADAFSLITSEIPTTLQSDMTNLYLSGYKPEVDREGYELTCKNGNYRPGSDRMDTVRDVCASLLTRESPLQQSHPKTDRILRVGGSTATGAAQGAGFWLLSSFFQQLVCHFVHGLPLSESHSGHDSCRRNSRFCWWVNLRHQIGLHLTRFEFCHPCFWD